MSDQNTSLTFTEKKDEETISVFLLEDIIKEYNHKIVSPPLCVQKNKVPLSLRPLHETFDNPIIRPMTREEISAMRNYQNYQLQGDDWSLLNNILMDQISPKGLISNIPSIVQGVSLVEIAHELGLKGKVYYKTMGEKTYVILKGSAAERNILKGTRYLNTNPQMIQFGLAKVGFKTLFKSGFKTSVWIYGAIKAVEATEMLLKDGELKTSFFSEIVTDIPKMAITSAVAAAVGAVGVAAIGVPVAVGVGIVLAVGFLTGVALEYVDKKTGFTEKFNDAANKMWQKLRGYFSSTDTHLQAYNWDPSYGLVFEESLAGNQVIRQGNYFVFTA